jgi:CubicO group peptidase (beta-lactamase class C family)
MVERERSGLRLASLFVAALCALTQRCPAQDASPDATGKIAVALQPFVDRHALAGAVTLVADKDKILSLEAVGFTDVAARTPMHSDAVFWIASQSKPMTATAFMMLVDEGKVRLDDPVEKYLPEFKSQWLAVERDNKHVLLKRPEHSITVREILSHTSGMPFKSAMEEPTLDLLPLRDAVRSYAMTPLEFEPGSKYQYSNAGINTAGRIIEVASGIDYAEFMQKRLFEPLGMKDTTFWPSAEQLARLAKSYKPNAAKFDLDETTVTQLRYPLNDHERQPMPAGGLFSTARDVGRFCQMILGHGIFEGKRYLSEASVEQMTSKQTGKHLKDGYGLGWSTGGGRFGHGGAYATNMTIDPASGLITVFMVQHAGFPRDGNRSQAAFENAVLAQFGSSRQ